MAKRWSDGSLCVETVAKATSGEAFESDYSAVWKIKNFLTVKSFKNLIDEQILDFVVGESDGYPTKWRCDLQEKPETDNIGIYLTLLKTPSKFRPVVKFSFQMVKPSGGIFKIGEAKAQEFTDSKSWGFRLIPRNEKQLEALIWKDGSIVIKVSLNLLLFKPAVLQNELDVEQEHKLFEIRELQKLSLSMTRMIEVAREPDLGKIIKIVSKDGHEFYANTATLSARSPVFEAMFSSGNWIEGQSSLGEGGNGNSLVLEDLSGKTVKVLVHFLVGGVLLKDEWKAEDVILELTYAAQKYLLEGLTEFLDKVLPAINYRTGILAKLTLLTKRLGMKNAEVGLFSKLKETAADIEQLVLDKGGALFGDN